MIWLRALWAFPVVRRTLVTAAVLIGLYAAGRVALAGYARHVERRAYRAALAQEERRHIARLTRDVAALAASLDSARERADARVTRYRTSRAAAIRAAFDSARTMTAFADADSAIAAKDSALAECAALAQNQAAIIWHYEVLDSLRDEQSALIGRKVPSLEVLGESTFDPLTGWSAIRFGLTGPVVGSLHADLLAERTFGDGRSNVRALLRFRLPVRLPWF